MAVLMLAVLGGITAVVDPCFHYHPPLPGLTYPIFDQRYQNDGIISHFDYDAVIIGTSMTENFKTSEMDQLFGVNAIKVPFSGGTFKEIDSNLRNALETNPDLKMVIRALDGYMLCEDKDAMRTDAVYPEYLYDENPFNDVYYLFNKSILFQYTVKAVQRTMAGMETTGFDEYSSWAEKYDFGPDAVLDGYVPAAKAETVTVMDEESAKILRENVRQNVVALAEENPDVTFYYYYPPYSIMWWCNLYTAGTMEKQLDAYRIATEEILKCPNIRLYSFVGEFEMTTDLENYMDYEHHTGQINSEILEDLHAGNGMLTKENCQEHWDEVAAYYGSFDYASYLKEVGNIDLQS